LFGSGCHLNDLEMSSEPMNYKKQHGLWCKYFMVCESEPDAPWGLLIMTSVREALTDRRRDVAVLVCFSWPFFTTHHLLDLMRKGMMLLYIEPCL